MRKIFYTLLFSIFLAIGQYAHSTEPYHVVLKAQNQTVKYSLFSLTDFDFQLTTSFIQVSIPGYTANSPATLDTNLRGIFALGSLAQNSKTFVVAFPQLGTIESFTGSTRESSLKKFRDFIEDGGRNKNLLQAYAKYSPIDPIAGNPNSLQSQMGQADYMLNRLSPLSGCSNDWKTQPIFNQIQIGAYVGRAFAGGYDTSIVTFPIRYTCSPDLDRAFIIDLPITYLRNGGASSYLGSLGLAYRFPIWEQWSVTPVIRYGGGGSVDLNTQGAFVSAAVVSVLDHKVWKGVLSINNYVGYIRSVNFLLAKGNFNYHLSNVVFRNGFSYTTCEPVCYFNKPWNFSFTFEDSYTALEQLYIRHYDEIGFNVITNFNNPLETLSIGFSFQFGGNHGYHGYFLNGTYQF